MPDISSLKGIEQKRAAFAYKCAEEGRDINVKKEDAKSFNIGNELLFFADKQYKSYCRKIPMMIKTNGLGNAFAFVLSKKVKPKEKKECGETITIKAGAKENPKNAYDLIYEQVSVWLKSEDKKYLLDGKESQDLVRIFIQLDSAQYRAVTNEVMAFFNWLKRFADGLIEGEAEGDE